MKKLINLRFLVILVAGFSLFQACVPGAPEPTAELSYASDISPLMTNYCLTCHSGPAASAGLNLDNYTGVRTIGETGRLVSRTNDSQSPMPPSGLMSEENRQKIQDWVNGGYQE